MSDQKSVGDLAFEAQAHAESAPIQAGFRGALSVKGRLIDWFIEQVKSGKFLDDEAKKKLKAAVLVAFDTIILPGPAAWIVIVKPIIKPMLDNLLDAVLGLPLDDTVSA